jgi:hypothetical protein
VHSNEVVFGMLGFRLFKAPRSKILVPDHAICGSGRTAAKRRQIILA